MGDLPRLATWNKIQHPMGWRWYQHCTLLETSGCSTSVVLSGHHRLLETSGCSTIQKHALQTDCSTSRTMHAAISRLETSDTIPSVLLSVSDSTADWAGRHQISQPVQECCYRSEAGDILLQTVGDLRLRKPDLWLRKPPSIPQQHILSPPFEKESISRITCS